MDDIHEALISAGGGDDAAASTRKRPMTTFEVVAESVWHKRPRLGLLDDNFNLNYRGNETSRLSAVSDDTRASSSAEIGEPSDDESGDGYKWRHGLTPSLHAPLGESASGAGDEANGDSGAAVRQLEERLEALTSDDSWCLTGLKSLRSAVESAGGNAVPHANDRDHASSILKAKQKGARRHMFQVLKREQEQHGLQGEEEQARVVRD